MTKLDGSLVRTLRAYRQERRWTLQKMSDAAAIPVSTLSKVESGRLTLSFERLKALAARLGEPMARFTEAPQPEPPPAAVLARRSLTLEHNSIRLTAGLCEYEVLCADMLQKRMSPTLARIHAQEPADYADPLCGGGERFIFVLEGAVEVRLKFYTPTVLRQGQGMYLDAGMTRAVLTSDCESALLLSVSSDPAGAAREQASP